MTGHAPEGVAMAYRPISGLLLVSAALSVGADWPQFLGPTRDGHSPETGLKREWPNGGPSKLWEVDVGAGFSGPVVVDGKVFVYHRLGDQEVLECRTAADGKEGWKSMAPTGYVDDFRFDDGPRGTPAVAGNNIYTLGAEGRLACMEIESGKVVWERNLGKDFSTKKGFFGVGTSPVVDSERVYVNVGGAGAGMVAFDRKTGRTLWQSTDDEASYSTPTLAELSGKRRLVAFTRRGLLVLDPATGSVEHQMDFRARIHASVNAASPLIADDQVFLTTSYNTGAILLDAGKNAWKPVWKNDESLSCHYNTPAKVGAFVFGIHGRQEYGPELRCIEWATGKVRWKQPGFGCASLIAADGMLIAAVETGELVLLEANESEYREKGRFQALEKPERGARPANALSMALSEGRLFVRDGKKLAAWDLRK
jgi:outer membrane protein assembly factor BamB